MADGSAPTSIGHNRKPRMIEVECPDCGSAFLKALPKKDRSIADHRRFFALIGAAFSQWPTAHEFQPQSEEHLRAWLLCKVHRHEVEFISIGAEIFDGLSGDTLEIVNKVVQSAVRRSVEAAMRQSGKFAFDKAAGNRIAIFRPKSIDWQSMTQAEFNQLRDDVEALIEEVVGVPAGKLLEEARNVA